MAVVPGGDEQLVAKSDTTTRILGRDMSVVSSFELPTIFGEIAASDEFIYAADNDARCFTHAGTEVAQYTEPDKIILYPTPAPGGRLYCLFAGVG